MSDEIEKVDDDFAFLYSLESPKAIIDGEVDSTKFAVSTPPSDFDPDEFRYICNAAYSAFTYLKRIPTVGEVQKYCGSAAVTIRKAIDTKEFSDSMRALGVPWHSAEGLTAMQILAIQILTNPTDKRPLRNKLKGIGVSYPQYRAWMRQPAFNSYMARISEDMLTDHAPDFMTVLTQKALDGDLNSIKYVYELSGRHDPNKQQVIELQAIVQQLIEVIARNVTDTEVLTRISNEFGLIMNSKATANGPVVRGEING